MAVAEKSIVETPPRSPRQRLLIGSALGALYVIASFELVFMGLPLLWRAINLTQNEFLADSVLVLVTLPLILGLFVLGKRLEGPNPPRGLRAGATYICVALFVGGVMATADTPLWNVLGLVLLVGAAVLLFQPGFAVWLAHMEDLGWFHATSFKASQGQRVRRATVMAIMVLVICGIITAIWHDTLRTGERLIEVGNNLAMAKDAWIVNVPFSTQTFVALWRISLTVPILMLVVSFWIAWRVVNWPTFADFLIATEAEMNKVSWTTRKRLYQDTVVVLVTVVLFTVFLFVVDIIWIKILTCDGSRFPWLPVDVLKHDPAEAARKNQAGAQW
jgi:preprotein translocase SecE subunit